MDPEEFSALSAAGNSITHSRVERGKREGRFIILSEAMHEKLLRSWLGKEGRRVLDSF